MENKKMTAQEKERLLQGHILRMSGAALKEGVAAIL